MDPEIVMIVISIISILAVVGIVAWLILRYALNPQNIEKEIQRQAQLQHQAQEDPFETTFTTQEFRATVMDHTCKVRLVVTKTPKATKIFTVVFRTEDNKILSFNVPEEMYDGFEKGQAGILTVVDGELYGFAIEE